MLYDRVNLELGNGIPHTRYEKYLTERFPALKELIDSKPIPQDRVCRFQVDNSKDKPQIWHNGAEGSKVFLQPAETDIGRLLKLGDPLIGIHERTHEVNFKLGTYTESEFRAKLMEDEIAAISEEAKAARKLNRTNEAEKLESLAKDEGAVLEKSGKAFKEAWESTRGDSSQSFVEYSNTTVGEAMKAAMIEQRIKNPSDLRAKIVAEIERQMAGAPGLGDQNGAGKRVSEVATENLIKHVRGGTRFSLQVIMDATYVLGDLNVTFVRAPNVRKTVIIKPEMTKEQAWQELLNQIYPEVKQNRVETTLDPQKPGSRIGITDIVNLAQKVGYGVEYEYVPRTHLAKISNEPVPGDNLLESMTEVSTV